MERYLLNYLLDAFTEFSQSVAPVVVTALWQGAILACGVAVCLRIAPRASAAHRFWIWAAGFLVVAGLPVLPMLLPLLTGAFAGGAAGTSSLGGVQNSSQSLLRLDLRWSLVIGALWIAASVFRALDLGIHSLRLRRLWKTARVVSALHQQSGCPWSLALGDQGKRNLNLGRPAVEICTTTDLDRPSVIGFFAPRILIPEWLYARLTPEELEQVILHENEHLRRHDDWTNLLQKICLVVFPLNPALAWMERRLCREREMACDDGVVRATQAPRAYAACLTSLAERGLERRAEIVSGALSLGAWQRRPELVERVHRILRRTPGLSPLAASALVGLMGCALVAGSIEFARCPQLVAFVPTARVAAQQDAATELGDARFTDASFVAGREKGAGFRAVEAVAHVPIALGRSDRTNTRNAGPSTPLRAAQDDSKIRTQHDSKIQMMKTASVRGDGSLNGHEKPAQQWIVFTAWEQVESSGAGQIAKQDAGLRQDYDSSATDEQGTSDVKKQTGERNSVSDTNSSATGKITITRLIFRIYQTGPVSAGPASGSDSTSSADQPAIVPLRDGWIVFQL